MNTLIKDRPEEVINKLVPQMMREADIRLRENAISQDQFRMILNEATDLRERAMIQRADNQERNFGGPQGAPQGGPQSGPQGPWNNGPMNNGPPAPHQNPLDLPIASADDLDLIM